MDAGKAEMTRVCVRCKKNLADDANVCPHCGQDYRPVMMGHAWEDERTPLPPIGGALIALSGVTHVVAGLLWLSGFGYDLENSGSRYEELYWAVGLALILVGVFAAFVSPFAMTRRRLSLSLAGGLAALGGGTMAVMFTLSMASGSLGLVGVLLIALARDEFVD